MTTVEIKVLNQLSQDDLKRLITGYVSDSKYVVQREYSEARMAFALELVRLEKPYVKQYADVDAEAFEHYRRAVREGMSLGAYEGDQLVGLAIAEAQRWNMSLWVWEFHVAEEQRGKGIGRAMMEALAEKSRTAYLRAIFCETQTTNVPAIRFYRRVGFVLDGLNLSLYTNNDWPDGEIAVFMKRGL